jgi:fatty acid desaturase
MTTRRRLRIPRSTIFLVIGIYLLVNEVAIVHRAPNPWVLLAGLLLMGAVPVEVVEAFLRRSVLGEPKDDEK